MPGRVHGSVTPSRRQTRPPECAAGTALALGEVRAAAGARSRITLPLDTAVVARRHAQVRAAAKAHRLGVGIGVNRQLRQLRRNGARHNLHRRRLLRILRGSHSDAFSLHRSACVPRARTSRSNCSELQRAMARDASIFLGSGEWRSSTCARGVRRTSIRSSEGLGLAHRSGTSEMRTGGYRP